METEANVPLSIPPADQPVPVVPVAPVQLPPAVLPPSEPQPIATPPTTLRSSAVQVTHSSSVLKWLGIALLTLAIAAVAFIGGFVEGEKTMTAVYLPQITHNALALEASEKEQAALMASPTPTPDSQQTSTLSGELDTSNWKTFTDPHSGASLQYPPDWVALSGGIAHGVDTSTDSKSGQQSVKCLVKDECIGLSMGYVPESIGTQSALETAKQYFDQANYEEIDLGPLDQPIQAVKATRNAQQESASAGNVESIVVKTPQGLFIVIQAVSPVLDKYRQILDQMYRTFKFSDTFKIQN